MTLTSVRMAGKKPNPVDTHVGSRVRLRRMLLGMSQERLGQSMGLTFQQVQKYEKGSNRMSASRLQLIAHTLQAPIPFFFEGIVDMFAPLKGSTEKLSIADVQSYLATSEGLTLTKTFMQIKDAKLRRSIVNLVEQIADCQ